MIAAGAAVHPTSKKVRTRHDVEDDNDAATRSDQQHLDASDLELEDGHEQDGEELSTQAMSCVASC